jgi:hypothetical protein
MDPYYQIENHCYRFFAWPRNTFNVIARLAESERPAAGKQQ